MGVVIQDSALVYPNRMRASGLPSVFGILDVESIGRGGRISAMAGTYRWHALVV